MQKRRTQQLSWLWLSVLIIVLDQATKLGVSHWLDRTSVVPLFPCLNLILTHNSGAAFSFLGQADGWQRWFFVAISSSVSLWLIALLFRGDMNHWVACGMALILGGAMGNLCDRLVQGYVIDFIDFCIGHWHFATFNLADSAISVGVMIWVLASFRFARKRR